MAQLKTAVAIFCTACVGAEIVEQLTQQVHARRCIKAIAGLYIVAALLQALPGIGRQSTSLELPGSTQESFGTFAQNVLQRAERQLETTLQDAIYADTGCRVRLEISLVQTQAGVSAAAAQVEAETPVNLSPEQQAAIRALLLGRLGTENIEFGEEEET